MTTIPVNNDIPRAQYVASSGQTDFVYDWFIFVDDDLDVYVDDVKKSLTADFTVSGANTEDGGNVVFNSAFSGGEIVTIEGNVDISRPADLQQAGKFDPDDYNLEQDKNIVIMKQLARDLDRKLGLPVTSTSDLTTLQTNLNTVAGISSNVNTVAGIAGNVNTVAGISSNVNAVAAVDDDVVTVAGIASDVTSVASGDYGVTASGSSVARNVADRFAERYNAKDYGAVGDGVTNDTAAIQAMLDAGYNDGEGFSSADQYPANGEILFPAGTYLVDGIKFYGGQRIVFHKNAELIPTDSCKFVLRLASSPTDTAYNNAPTRRCEKPELHGVLVDMQRKATCHVGILIEAADEPILIDCNVVNIGNGEFTYQDSPDNQVGTYPITGIMLKGINDTYGVFYPYLEKPNARNYSDPQGSCGIWIGTSHGESDFKDVTAATNANPGVFTVAGHGYSNGERLRLRNSGWGNTVDGRYYIRNVTTDTFTLEDVDSAVALNTTSLGAIASEAQVAKYYATNSQRVNAGVIVNPQAIRCDTGIHLGLCGDMTIITPDITYSEVGIQIGETTPNNTQRARIMKPYIENCSVAGIQLGNDFVDGGGYTYLPWIDGVSSFGGTANVVVDYGSINPIWLNTDSTVGRFFAHFYDQALRGVDTIQHKGDGVSTIELPDVLRNSGNGVKFDDGVNLGSGSEDLNLYREGQSWVFSFQGVTATVDSQVSTYTRLNNKVRLDFDVDFSGLNTADNSNVAFNVPFDNANVDTVNGEIDYRNSDGLSLAAGDVVKFTNDGSAGIVRLKLAPHQTMAYSGGKILASGKLKGFVEFVVS